MSAEITAIAPGGTIGILGAGQLGRMLAMAAAQLGYRTHIFAPSPGPACDVATAFTRAPWSDADAADRFARAVDVVTYEFENVDAQLVARLAALVPVRPSAASLDVAGYRPNEKRLVRDLGGRTADYRRVASLAELVDARATIGGDAVLKTNAFGYDGKGQVRLDAGSDPAACWATLGSDDAILERLVDFDCEFSIVLARGADGAVAVYDPPHNEHADGILARSTLPAPPVVLDQFDAADRLSRTVAERIGHVGVLTLEFFATVDGCVFNEMAPRVHNSGHWTIEGAVTSQFENHIRAICGLPLGATTRRAPRVTMYNLIGDQVDGWRDLVAEPGAHLHLYGKHDARPGRKMGHVTRLGG